MKTNQTFPLLAAVVFLASILVAATQEAVPDVAPEKTKTCFQCNGSGQAKCTAPSCIDGQADCPAGCIKLRKGSWVKRPDLKRPDPNETMQDISVNGHGISVSSHHEGVYYVWLNGKAEMKTCPTCNGTTRIQCKVCKGKGIVTCPVCDGKKTVPQSWSAFDNPTLKTRPDKFTLKDGTAVVGYKKMATGSTIVIRTQTGDQKLDAANIVSEEKQPTQK